MAFDFGAFAGVPGLSAITGAIGLGVELFGAGKAMGYENQLAGIQTQEAQNSSQQVGLQMQVNRQRQQQMMLIAQRQQMQNVRNLQRAQAAGVATAASQGAQFGSGLAGGLAGAAGQAGTNAVDTSQNLGIGENIFGLDYQQDILKQQMALLQGKGANIQGQVNIWQGIQGIGAGLVGGSQNIGQIGTTGGKFLFG